MRLLDDPAPFIGHLDNEFCHNPSGRPAGAADGLRLLSVSGYQLPLPEKNNALSTQQIDGQGSGSAQPSEARGKRVKNWPEAIDL